MKIIEKLFVYGSFSIFSVCDPVGIQTQDLQNRKQTLKSPKTPLFIGLSRICPFHFAAILRLSQTGTWFICLFLFKLLLVFNDLKSLGKIAV